MRTWTIVLSMLSMAVPGATWAACNTRTGVVANQPPPPTDEEARREAVAESISLPAGHTSFDAQVLRLDLARDLTSLTGLTGRYTLGAPVLGVRLENVTGYDPKQHCNAIQPIVYKPKIERLDDGSVRASVEDGRFAISFDPRTETRLYAQDADPTGRFFWIFRPRFGAPLKKITKGYDDAYLAQELGSTRRRWIAEAYINLAFRYHRLKDLNAGMPTGWRPKRDDLRRSLMAALGHDCIDGSAILACMASEVVELNEAAPPGNELAQANFTVGDALLANSGVSTGVRQLDFGSRNTQAAMMATRLFPSLRGMDRLGYGYRRPIRTWDIDTQNRWFAVDGRLGNALLSRDETKRMLLASHGTYLRDAVASWRRRLAAAYASFTQEDGTALIVIGVDLENVTGRPLLLPQGATTMCDVLSNTTLTGGRSNAGTVFNQMKRVRTAQMVISKRASMQALDWSCLDRLPGTAASDTVVPVKAASTSAPAEPAADDPASTIER